MTTLINAANWLLPMLYLGLLIEYGSAFFLRVRASGRPTALAAVVAIHMGLLVLLGMHLGRPSPVGDYEILSVLAAVTAGVYALVEFLSRERRTGAFVMLAVFLLQYTSSVLGPTTDIADQAAMGGWHPHTIPAIVAYVGSTIAAIHGALHLLARRNLRKHRFGLLFDRLPPLELLGKMTWHSLLVGFVFLTLAIASGAAMVFAVGGGMAGATDSRTLAMMIAGTAAWIIYAVAIGGRIAGWDAARVSGAAVGGFVVVLAMLVISIVLS